jgi:hypothetical protein
VPALGFDKLSPNGPCAIECKASSRVFDRLCRPQALATFEMPLLLTGALDKVPSRSYILADGWDPSPFRYFAAQAEAAGWNVAKLPCSHDVMVDMPNELTAELLKLA